jgi:SAM-dependent methyltransferase
MPNPAVPSFQNADAYEQVMGRWSRRLAPPLIRFGGLSDGDRVLDVGCRTGSLAFALLEITNVTGVTGIDLTEPYLEFARARNADPRISFQQADARVLPFEDNSFDRAFSMLVLQFIPDATRSGRDASCCATQRHSQRSRVGCLRRHVAHTHAVGHCRRARSVHRAAFDPTIEQTKRNVGAVARAWLP